MGADRELSLVSELGGVCAGRSVLDLRVTCRVSGQRYRSLREGLI